MWIEWLDLIFMLIIILISAELLTNGLEYFGEKIGISEGVTGSIFAAIVTALPETTVPILAIFAGTSDRTLNEEISVGAILGAPLMLSTLAISFMALFAINQRGIFGKIKPEVVGLKRDLDFFLVAFLIAAVAMFVPLNPIILRLSISLFLVLIYVVYLLKTVQASKQLVLKGHKVCPDEPLYLTQIGLKNNSLTLLMQLILGVVLLIMGAQGFIHGVEDISKELHISALLLALLIIPIATELPEKFNSILWVRKNKDTLASGNITGAMVFQGTLLPALGILLTPWQPSRYVLTGVIVTFIAACWLRVNAAVEGTRILVLLMNGVLYLVYLVMALYLFGIF